MPTFYFGDWRNHVQVIEAKWNQRTHFKVSFSHNPRRLHFYIFLRKTTLVVYERLHYFLLSCRGLCSRRVAHPALFPPNRGSSVRLYIEGCRHVIVHPRGLFVHVSLFATDWDVSQMFAFCQCSRWISVESWSTHGGAEVIFLPPLCIITYVPFAGSKTKCYFYLEVLQKQNVNKIQAFFGYLSMFVGTKGAVGSFFILQLFLN